MSSSDFWDCLRQFLQHVLQVRPGVLVFSTFFAALCARSALGGGMGKSPAFLASVGAGDRLSDDSSWLLFLP